MRYALNPQVQIGETVVSAIEFDAYSRDDIPQLLRGLQSLYEDTDVRDAVLEQLGTAVIAETDRASGHVVVVGPGAWRSAAGSKL